MLTIHSSLPPSNPSTRFHDLHVHEFLAFLAYHRRLSPNTMPLYTHFLQLHLFLHTYQTRFSLYTTPPILLQMLFTFIPATFAWPCTILLLSMLLGSHASNLLLSHSTIPIAHLSVSLITSSYPFHHIHKPIFSLYPFIRLTTIPPSIPPTYSFSHHLSLFDPSTASCILPEHPSNPSFTSHSRAWSLSCMATLVTFPPFQYPSPVAHFTTTNPMHTPSYPFQANWFLFSTLTESIHHVLDTLSNSSPSSSMRTESHSCSRMQRRIALTQTARDLGKFIFSSGVVSSSLVGISLILHVVHEAESTHPSFSMASKIPDGGRDRHRFSFPPPDRARTISAS